MRAYADANKDAATVGRKKRYAEKRDLLRRQSREWAAANPDKRRAQHAERKARERGAVPPWYGELDSFVLREAADLCILRRNATGFEWHIDHMVPLRAKKASGLHCHTNFQVIPAAMNISKRNKMQLIEPLEWLQKL